MEDQISEKNAKEQFDLLMDFYDVDLDLIGDDKGKMNIIVETKLVKAIRQGKVEVVDSPEGFSVRQTIKNGDVFIYQELTGTAKVQMDRFEGKHERLYALLGMLAKTKAEKIQNFTSSDLSIAEYLGIVFLAG